MPAIVLGAGDKAVKRKKKKVEIPAIVSSGGKHTL